MTAVATYCRMLGDDALIMSHRLQQWVTRAPELEDEMAIANIALDLLGQARLLLSQAGDEDALAFRRPAAAFGNVLLAERRDADFAELTARLFAFATWRLELLDALRDLAQLGEIAARALPEVSYHRGYAARWVIRLGDGTDESHRRMQSAVDAVWPLIPELFAVHDVEQGLGVDPAALRTRVEAVLTEVLARATLTAPALPPPAVAGRAGRHTPALDEILDELQSTARELPGGVW